MGKPSAPLPSKSQELLLSLVICTYNRAALVDIVLATLAEQSPPLPSYEIIVVDNNSRDNTRQVVEARCASMPNLRYVFEPKQGLSNARNRGVAESAARYVAFFDDELKVPATWLSTAAQIISERAPEVFGGPYFAWYSCHKPAWYKDIYASHDQGDTPRPLSEHEWLDGGNIVFDKALLEELGGFRPDLGMNGKTMLYGEETELQKRLRQKRTNAQIFYHPGLRVYHMVRPEKLSMRSSIVHFYKQGVSSQRVANQPPPSGRALLREALAAGGRFVKEILRALLTRDKSRHPYAANHIYECALPHLHRLGALREALRMRA